MTNRHDTFRTDATVDDDDRKHRSTRASLALHKQCMCWRSAIRTTHNQRLAALLALVLGAAALLAMFNTHRVSIQTLSTSLRRTTEGDPRNSAAALLDGRATAQSLPQVYPNGATNVHRCDLPSLRYQCDQDATVGCRAYPQLFPTGDLLKNWPPDKPSEQPAHIFSSICRFNVSIPVRPLTRAHPTLSFSCTRSVLTCPLQYELELAQVFHQMEVPFIVYGIPALDLATTRWTNEVRLRDALCFRSHSLDSCSHGRG